MENLVHLLLRHLLLKFFQLRILIVKLNSIAKTIEVLERIADVLFGVLLFLHALHNPRQLGHYLLHSLDDLIIVLLRSIGEPLGDRVLSVIRHDGGYVDVFSE